MKLIPKIEITGWAATVAIVIITVVSSMITYQLSSRDKDKVDYQTILVDLRTSVQKLESRVETLTQQNSRQAQELAVLKAGFYDDPTIRWIKQIDGRYLYFNNAFRETFLIPNGIDPDFAIGLTDEEIFGKSKYTETWRKNDLQVISTRRKHEQYESIIVNNEKRRYKSIKYPYYAPNSFRQTILGTAGVAIEVD